MTADNKVEMKPCAFCGGLPQVHQAMGEHWIACWSCQAGPRMLASYEAAVEAWNRRPSSGDARVLDEALKLLLEITFFHFTHTFSDIQNDSMILEKWIDFDERAWKLVGFDPIEAANDPEYLAKALAKLSELRTTAKEEKK